MYEWLNVPIDISRESKKYASFSTPEITLSVERINIRVAFNILIVDGIKFSKLILECTIETGVTGRWVYKHCGEREVNECV
jgi:hypothetical protein